MSTVLTGRFLVRREQALGRAFGIVLGGVRLFLPSHTKHTLDFPLKDKGLAFFMPFFGHLPDSNGKRLLFVNRDVKLKQVRKESYVGSTLERVENQRRQIQVVVFTEK